MNLNAKVTKGSPVSLADVLQERENRAETQQKLITTYDRPLVCFTLNIPGEYKQFPLLRHCFKLCLDDILLHLPSTAIYQSVQENSAGSVAYIVLDMPAQNIKQLTLDIECTHPLGRIFDLDVIGSDGHKLSRTDFGMPPRKCYLCDNIAAVCGRNRTHSMGDVVNYIVSKMDDYVCNKLCWRTVQAVNRALLFEVATTPKPGLVDCSNNGAHTDMDIFSFIDSASQLLPYFSDFFTAGYRHYGTPCQLFLSLRQKGIVAEKRMHEATGGINTHKGAIFTLGLMCAAYGVMSSRHKPHDENDLLDYCKLMLPPLMDELESDKDAGNMTNGERIFASSGITGIRGEATGGFMSIRQHSLPVLRRFLAEGFPLSQAGIASLLALMANVDDTNIIHRSSIYSLRSIQRTLKAFMRTNPTLEQIISRAITLDSELISKNISPGGCADLLAATYFLHFIYL